MTAPADRPALVALWSAPRCRSTAFLRMMVERGDFAVVHEPFSHVTDFGEAQVGDQVVRAPEEAMRALLALSRESPVFLKDTTDFRYPAVLTSPGFLRAARHTFLIRDLRDVIASHHRVNPAMARDEIGFGWLHEVFVRVREVVGETPLVLDADDLVRQPDKSIHAYCQGVGIPYLEDALTWEAGMLPRWEQTPSWYAEVSSSTGFHAAEVKPDLARRRAVEEDPTLRGHYLHHLPFYEELRAHRLRI